MNGLRILFRPADKDQSYLAHLTDAGGNALGVEVPFAPFLTDDDYENLRWYLEDYMDLPDGGAVTRARGIEKELDQWGHTLHDALFAAKENRDLLKSLLAQKEEPRELTLATQDPALLRLPWELMADTAGRLALRVSVRRQLEEPEKSTTDTAKLPLRIL
jgi:hypothetical protein